MLPVGEGRGGQGAGSLSHFRCWEEHWPGSVPPGPGHTLGRVLTPLKLVLTVTPGSTQCHHRIRGTIVVGSEGAKTNKEAFGLRGEE